MQRTRVSVGSVTTAAANAFDPIVIIMELSYRIVYRDNFDLSYRLSIGNSIWHIVTALCRCVFSMDPVGGACHQVHCVVPPPTLHFRVTVYDRLSL